MTINELLNDYKPYELPGYLDKALQVMILFLRYEPEQLEPIIIAYDHISLLKQAIINYQKQQ